MEQGVEVDRFVPLSPETVTGSPTLPSSHLPGALAPTVHGPESAVQPREKTHVGPAPPTWSGGCGPRRDSPRAVGTGSAEPRRLRGRGFRRAGGWLVGGAVRALSRFFRPGGQG